MLMTEMLALTCASPRIAGLSRTPAQSSGSDALSRFRVGALGCCSLALVFRAFTASRSATASESSTAAFAARCAHLLNLSCDTVYLPKGSRVCQMVVVPFVPCDLVKVEKLSGTERGEDGFGSTGIE